MKGFEPRTSGFGSNCSTSWATMIALDLLMVAFISAIRTLLCELLASIQRLISNKQAPYPT